MGSLRGPDIHRIIKECRRLSTQAPEGITVYFNEDLVTDIQADIDGPINTPYEGGRFRVQLLLGNEWPNEPPKGYFLTKIFHPNIDNKTGEICVNTLKKDWSSDVGFERIFVIIKCLLIVPNPESMLNEEAGRLMLEKYDEYSKRAKLMTSIHALHSKLHDNNNNENKKENNNSSNNIGNVNGNISKDSKNICSNNNSGDSNNSNGEDGINDSVSRTNNNTDKKKPKDGNRTKQRGLKRL